MCTPEKNRCTCPFGRRVRDQRFRFKKFSRKGRKGSAKAAEGSFKNLQSFGPIFSVSTGAKCLLNLKDSPNMKFSQGIIRPRRGRIFNLTSIPIKMSSLRDVVINCCAAGIETGARLIALLTTKKPERNNNISELVAKKQL